MTRAMNRRWAGLAAVLWCGASFAQEARRPRIDVEHYRLAAEINPRTQSIAATVDVEFTSLEDRVYTPVFELNNALNVSRVVDEKDQQIPAARSQQDFTVRLTLAEALNKGSKKKLTFTYSGTLSGAEESPVYGIKFAAIQNDFAYLMLPARWFPLADYATDRFTAEMSISVPADFRVIASGLETATKDGEKATYAFRTLKPSFPGSIALVKGEPARISSQGVTTSLYFRGESRPMAQPYGEETGKLMALSTSAFGLPPQASLTLVETEEGTPGGYAAPGIVFLSPKAIGKQVNSRLLAGQIARQWWGLLVSPASRNHIWITNGMAKYAEMIYIEQTPGSGSLEADLRDIFIEALTVEGVPLIQAGRLEDYSPEYWAATGAKGAAVYHMLRPVMGEDKFSALLKELPAQFDSKPVTTYDVRDAASRLAGKDLGYFFIQWIESLGAPEFKLEYTVYRTQKGFRVMGKIAQDLDTFRMPVTLKIETEGNPEEKTVDVVGTSSEFVVETFGKPKKVDIDAGNRVLRFNDSVRIAVAIRRGEQFAEIGEFGEALKEYQKALEVSRASSLAHYRVAEVFFLQNNYQSAANEFREALNGDLEPEWTEVWSHINLGKIFDITGQRERAVNEYNLGIRTKDNTQGAQEEAAKYLKEPFKRDRPKN